MLKRITNKTVNTTIANYPIIDSLIAKNLDKEYETIRCINAYATNHNKLPKLQTLYDIASTDSIYSRDEIDLLKWTLFHYPEAIIIINNIERYNVIMASYGKINGNQHLQQKLESLYPAPKPIRTSHDIKYQHIAKIIIESLFNGIKNETEYGPESQYIFTAIHTMLHINTIKNDERPLDALISQEHYIKAQPVKGIAKSILETFNPNHDYINYFLSKEQILEQIEQLYGLI